MLQEREIGRSGLDVPRGWVEEIVDGTAFAAMREEWSQLLADSGAGPFLSWDWLYPWWRRVGASSEPRLLAARDERGRLFALLPLCERTELRAGIAVHRWGFLGDGEVGSDYLEPIAARGREAASARLFAAHLAARMQRIDVLELLELPEGSVFAEAVLGRLSPGALEAERFRRYVCPLVQIEGPFEQYLRQVGRADNLARRRKWLAQQPGFSIERAERPEETARALADFLRLHRLRWESDGASQGINSAALRSFHRDAALNLAESGMLRLYTLRLGTEPLASIYGIVQRDRFYFYQSGYDPAWARRSVGLVLLGEAIGDAFREQRSAFELLHGEEPYKLEWASGRRRTEGVRIVRRSPGGAAWLAAAAGSRLIKGVARVALGGRLWEQLRRARRRSGAS
jgi:CelD/BcsL family acetyltransferase involved in cellulose biosynthesis